MPLVKVMPVILLSVAYASRKYVGPSYMVHSTGPCIYFVTFYMDYLTNSFRSRGDYRGIVTEPRVLEWRGNYFPIITETEETNCFSIYTHGKISKSKIENVLLNFLIGTSERDITHELIYNVLKCKIFSNIC